MSFPRYPKYKASGVEWLGDVPEHWAVRPLRSIGSAYGGLTGKTAEAFTDEGPNTSYYIPFTNILNNTVVEATRLDPVQVAEGDLQNEVHSGDLLFLMSSEDYEFLGFSAVVRDVPPRTFLNSFCKGIRPHAADGCPEYLNYFCRSRVGRALISQMGFGFTRINLRTGALLSTPVLYPPLPEQRAIAAFLDRETAKIDGLVAEQQRLIELLKEKRQAVISHAVTKGLDPKAPMKPSGVEWLGDVPAHWEVKRLRGLFRQTKRQDQDSKPVLSVYRDHGVVLKDSRDDNNNKTPEDLSLYQLVQPGDLVVNKMKAWQGSLGISAIEGITSPDYAVFVPRHAEEGAFLHLLLRSAAMVSQYHRISNGIRLDQWRLETDLFLNMGVCLPSRDEQRSIAEKLGGKLRQVDDLAAEAESAISLLQERRSALISAAVTGQIDVRNAAATEAA